MNNSKAINHYDVYDALCFSQIMIRDDLCRLLCNSKLALIQLLSFTISILKKQTYSSHVCDDIRLILEAILTPWGVQVPDGEVFLSYDDKVYVSKDSELLPKIIQKRDLEKGEIIN